MCLEKRTDLKTSAMDIPTFRNGADGELAEETREADQESGCPVGQAMEAL